LTQANGSGEVDITITVEDGEEQIYGALFSTDAPDGSLFNVRFQGVGFDKTYPVFHVVPMNPGYFAYPIELQNSTVKVTLETGNDANVAVFLYAL